jgi:hypothetical protein
VLSLLVREGHLGDDVVKMLPLGGYIVLDDEDAPVLLRRGVRDDGEILNVLLGGTPESTVVSLWIRCLLGGIS